MSEERKFAPYSVLMSVYAKENPEYLKKSVDSMFSQSVAPSEFVLVIDGPIGRDLQDAIADLSEKFPLKEVYLPSNVGLGMALNAGLKHCTNEIVARMDSDDIALPERMEKQLELLEKADADIVSAAVCEFEGDVNNITATRTLPETHDEIIAFVRKRNPFNHPAVVYKKGVIQGVGGYMDFKLFEDYELFARALANGARGANAKEPLVLMRAGDAMYDRRGGRQYAKKMRAFYKRMSELGLCSAKEKLTCVFPRTVVALMPNFLRRFVYKKFLRG